MNAKQIATTILVLSVSALLTGTTTRAQAPGGGGGGGQQPSMPSQPQPQQNPNMGYPGTEPGTAPSPQTYGDQAFVSKALEGSDAEVQLGQLAEQKSQSEDVKQFAQKMVADHTQMDDKWFKPVAKQLGVPQPKGPSKKDKKQIAKLESLSGADFDTAYIQTMVNDHKEDLKDFQTEANIAQDPNVKMVAQQGSTIISQHLQLIETIAKNHNVDADGKTKEAARAD